MKTWHSGRESQLLDEMIAGRKTIEGRLNREKFADYAVGDDCTGVGIVIDNRAGGAATNRPLLFNYLKSLRDDDILEPMEVSKSDTILNGFDISDKVYRV